MSPAYIPSIFSFTPSPKKRGAEQGLERYEAAKRRREEKEKTEAADSLVELSSNSDGIVYPSDTVTVATQTDLTVMVLSALEQDNQRMTTVCFQPHYGLRVTSIIDCFELFIEKPSDLLAKSCTWSQYKHYNTAKYLISITPQGIISFISNGWGGRASDKHIHIVEHSAYLNNLLPGDVVLKLRTEVLMLLTL